MIKLVERPSKHIPVEEEDGAESLRLSGRGDIFFNGERGEEVRDFRFSHIGGMTFVVEEDKLFDPVEVSLFGANAVMFEADDVADLIEEFRHRLILKKRRFEKSRSGIRG
jgi:hypothetical protein